jgi:hypothetical protein
VSNDSSTTGQPQAPPDAAPPVDPAIATTTPEPGTTAPTDPSAAPNATTSPTATEAPSAPSADDSAPAPSNSSAAPRALPVVLPSSETESPPSTPTPSTAPDSASALTGGDSAASGDATTSPQIQADARGKRLVLTASQDSFVRVVALDGVHGDHVRYSSMLHSGQSISFSDRKYTINVGDPAVVDISLDGINYGPHSDHSEPDTFTVESRQP